MSDSIRSDPIKALASNMVSRKKTENSPYILFLGAGASISSGCSSMIQIVDDYLKKNDTSMFEEWETIIKDADLKDKKCGELLRKEINEKKRSRFFSLWDTLDSVTRQSILMRYLWKDVPSEGYINLVQLIQKGFIKTIFSTNLDNLLEKALNNAGWYPPRDFIVLVNGKDRSKDIVEQLNSSRVRLKIIKLHGSLEYPTSYAFSPEEIFDFEAQIRSCLSQFINQSLIIVGYSGLDRDIDILFENKGGEIHFVKPTMPDANSRITQTLIVRRKGKTIDGKDGDFDTFFKKLMMSTNDEEERYDTPRTLTSRSTEMEFNLIYPGKFMMGSNDSDREQPVHEVIIKSAFYLGKYPVTQKQWKDVMGKNPSYFKGEDHPVEMISWEEVHEFINELNKKDDTDKYRLPSEAEWEYACRADTQTRYHFGDDESKLNEYAWYDKNAWYDIDRKTRPVGSKEPNSWELYDMHGNVWEYVQDSYHANYDGAPPDGSAWENKDSSDRVLRGGGWFNSDVECRSANRWSVKPKFQAYNLGFRLVREL